jgi:hypothetical protein
MPNYLPRLPYLVIDQNRCRCRDIVEGLFRRCQREGQKILLPDTAIYEFSNVSSPFLTWRRSLEEVCREPGMIVAGRSIGEMMREELQTGKPVTNVVDEEVTPRFQQLLTELRDGDDNRVNLALREVARFIDVEKRLREQHSANKAIVASLREGWQESLSEADLKLLRKLDEATFIRVLAELETAAIVFQAAKGDGCTDDTAYALTVGPSVYGHTVYALAALALDWLARGGLDGIDPGKITNDFFDLDYTVTATFCSDLITADERAGRIYSAMIRAFECRAQLIEALESEKQ